MAWSLHSCLPHKPLATVLALVNFKSRFNKTDQNDKNPKATTNKKTKKKTEITDLGRARCVPSTTGTPHS